MSILIKRLPEKKWEDITVEDVNNAIVFDNSEETRARFCEPDAVTEQLGDFGTRFIPATYDSFDADKDAITTLFAGNYASAVYIPGVKEEETIDALREVAWDFVAGSSDRQYARNEWELEVALKYIGYTRGEWVHKVGELMMNMILGL